MNCQKDNLKGNIKLNKTIKEIEKEFKQVNPDQTQLIEALIDKYKDDSRSGVTKLIDKYKKLQEAREQEIERTKQMMIYEKKYENYNYICGIDEVGRGPLAGPVMTAAVILPEDCNILYINDSKKLSEKKREILYDEILEQAVDYSLGSVSPEEIDEINILQATYKAMTTAIADLKIKPELVLVDAETIPGLNIRQISIVKGDSKSISIAAASIVAKVARDRLMVTYDKLYPEYNFASNKGYGSQEHIEAIRKYGPCPIHRRSFIKNFR